MTPNDWLRPKRYRPLAALALCTVVTVVSGCCSARATHHASSALDFLYPDRNPAAPARDVTLQLPLRVGLAFAPRGEREDPISEVQKQALLEKVAAAFTAHQGIGRLEVVPSVYLEPGGSFRNLDQLAATLGLDLMVLVSYDQAQFTESTRASWTYLTVIGPLLVQGEKNDTRTLMDAVVYDIKSRALLFRAAGQSTVKGSSSPLNEERKRRLFADRGFDQATVSLVTHLDTALAAFEQQARSGTVRGPGTPARVLAALAAAGGSLEAPLANLTGRGADAVRRALALPTAALALLSAGIALPPLLMGNQALDGVALALCGGALLLTGSRLRALPLLAAGALAVSLGAHLAVAKAAGDGSFWLPLATQALLAVSWLAVRLTRRAPPAAGVAGPHRFELWVANASLIAHAALGLVWLQAALAGRAHAAWGVPVEPLVLPLAGCALLTSGGPSRRRLVLGLGGIAAWPACQLLAARGWTDWSAAWLTALLMTTPALALLIAARRELARGLRRWTADWLAVEPDLRQPLPPECAATPAPALALPSRQLPPPESAAAATAAAVREALTDLLRTWCGLAVASCLLFAGTQPLRLAVALVALAWFAGVALDGRGWAAALPMGLLLPALLQLAVQLPMGRAGMAPLSAGGPPRLLWLVLASRRFALLPAAAAFAWGWSALAGTLGRHRRPQEREPLLAMEQILEAGTAAGLVNAFLVRPALSLPGHLLLAAVAAGWAVHHLSGAVSAARQASAVSRGAAPEAGAAQSATSENGVALGAAPAGGEDTGAPVGTGTAAKTGAAPAAAASGASAFAVVPGAARQDAWLMQGWLALGLLHGYTAGWLHFGSWAGPYVLLAAGAGLYVAAALCARSLALRALAEPWRHGGLLLPAAGGTLALARVWGGAAPVWEPALAAFLVSAWYFALTPRESRRWAPALASAGFLGGALLAVLVRAGLGRELYFLAPGVALLALAWLLRGELGPAWTRHLAAAGATCVYATPVAALSDQVSWIWLAALAVLTLAFGSASFAIRSRSLLLVSTAALLADLSFFVFKIGTTAPMLLWVFGLAVGLGMMLAAAFLESRRQGVRRELLRCRRGLGAWR
jgi:rhombotail lipoprotein